MSDGNGACPETPAWQLGPHNCPSLYFLGAFHTVLNRVSIAESKLKKNTMYKKSMLMQLLLSDSQCPSEHRYFAFEPIELTSITHTAVCVSRGCQTLGVVVLIATHHQLLVLFLLQACFHSLEKLFPCFFDPFLSQFSLCFLTVFFFLLLTFSLCLGLIYW